MTDNNRRQDGMNDHDLKNAALDHEIDAALTKLATAEPRAGLEERILANLRIEQERATRRSWWRWPAVAVLAAVIVLAAALMWKSKQASQNIAMQNPPASTQDNQHAGPQVANNGGSRSILPHEARSGTWLTPHAASRPPAIVPGTKLERFPSPQPLSEQETILARYVTNYPEYAALIAQARTEELRRDSTEEMSNPASNEDSQQRNK